MTDAAQYLRKVTYIIFASLILVSQTNARSPVNPGTIKSHSRITDNKEYIFVMLWTGNSRYHTALQNKYKRSGLYRNDGSVTPLWTVDWYEGIGVFPLSDGKHLLRFNREYLVNHQVALVLYKNGKAIRSFKIKDLELHDHTVKLTAKEFSIPNNVSYNVETGIISISLDNGLKYDVSMSAGDTNSVDKFNYPKQCGLLHNPLQSYPLDNLKMIGTEIIKNQRWVIVKTPEGISHRAKEGECIGKNYGTIVRITESETEVHEVIPDGFGGWIRRKSKIKIGD